MKIDEVKAMLPQKPERLNPGMYLSAYLLVRYRYRTTASLENEIRKPYFHANMATTIFFIV